MQDRGADFIVERSATGTRLEAPPRHYSIEAISTIERIKATFPEDDSWDNTLNWLFLSTSGVHGSYATLDEIEHYEPDTDEPDAWAYRPSLTALIVQARSVCIRYGGEIEVAPEDIPYLRHVVARTLEGITRSQEGNL
jgi:hypothetical protein